MATQIASDVTDQIHALARAGRQAQTVLAAMPSEDKAQALMLAAQALRSDAGAVLAANAKDIAAGEAAGLSPAMLDRLRLDADRLDGIASAVEAVAQLDDPVGQVIDQSQPENGLKLSRVRVPIGTIGIIYESRP
ncbi:MAG: gamma-glutamyl-phosphate reductase, partial [Erythrobacter sp.]